MNTPLSPPDRPVGAWVVVLYPMARFRSFRSMARIAEPPDGRRVCTCGHGDGYGRFGPLGGETVPAHRLAYGLPNAPMDSGNRDDRELLARIVDRSVAVHRVPMEAAQELAQRLQLVLTALDSPAPAFPGNVVIVLQPHAVGAEPPGSTGVATPRRRGRPPGSGYVTDPDDIRSAYRDLRRESGRRPTQEQVARKVRVDRRTLQRTIRNLGMPWPPEA